VDLKFRGLRLIVRWKEELVILAILGATRIVRIKGEEPFIMELSKFINLNKF
jgi:hypothetical protein